jgi:hypothetical protein
MSLICSERSTQVPMTSSRIQRAIWSYKRSKAGAQAPATYQTAGVSPAARLAKRRAKRLLIGCGPDSSTGS